MPPQPLAAVLLIVAVPGAELAVADATASGCAHGNRGWNARSGDVAAERD